MSARTFAKLTNEEVAIIKGDFYEQALREQNGLVPLRNLDIMTRNNITYGCMYDIKFGRAGVKIPRRV